MVGLSDYIQFERKMQRIFSDAIAELGKGRGWSVSFNDRFRAFNASIEVDIVIKKDHRIFAIAEIKATKGKDVFNQAKVQAKLTAEILQCPYFFVITASEYGFFGIENQKKEKCDRLISVSDIVGILNNSLNQQDFSENEWEKSINKLIEYVNGLNHPELDKNAIIQAIKGLFRNKIIYSIDKHIEFLPSDEYSLFNALLPDFTENKLCRFTSFNSLFRTINYKSHSMCSIVAMNDKSETSYVGNYLREHGNYPGASYLSSPDNWNQCFITSCCKIQRADDFTMLRLYSDNTKGVVLKYKLDRNLLKKGFILKSVSYQRENGDHPELNILQCLLAIKVGGFTVTLKSLNIWQHFFKPKEYAFEEEVRLLYQLPTDSSGVNSIKWIVNSEFNIMTPIVTFPVLSTDNQVPLIIEGIILGPKLIEREINQRQTLYLLKANDIMNASNIVVEISSIQHYR